jgi:hypothetical protein
MKLRWAVVYDQNCPCSRRDEIGGHGGRLRLRTVLHVCVDRERWIEALLSDTVIEECLNQPRFTYARKANDPDNFAGLPSNLADMTDAILCIETLAVLFSPCLDS